VGTLGGPQSFINLPGFPITRQGAVLGTADTKVADSDYPNFNPFIVGFADPYTAHAFKWQDGKLTDLGALPGNNSSAVFQINGSGVGAGMSETGALDPNTGYPAENAVLFKNGSVINLGTLPGGHESQATAVNDRGQIVALGTLPNGHQHLFLLNPTNKAPGAAASNVSRQSGGHHVTNLISTPSKRFLPRG
jgi:probable HAF family extracellular repeat protein